MNLYPLVSIAIFFLQFYDIEETCQALIFLNKIFISKDRGKAALDW